jgi:hypothetical protein
MPSLAYPMQRVVVKGTQIKAASSPDQEPNFYKFPPLDSNGPRCDVPSTVTVLAESQSIPIVRLPQDLNAHMLCEGPRKEDIPMPPPVFASVDHEVMGWYCKFGTDNNTNVNGVDYAFNDAELLHEFCSEWAPDSFYRDDDSDQCLKSIPYTEV